MFVVRTTEGLVLGPFSSYDIAKAWAGQVDDIYAVVKPRPDMVPQKGRKDRPAVCAH